MRKIFFHSLLVINLVLLFRPMFRLQKAYSIYSESYDVEYQHL